MSPRSLFPPVAWLREYRARWLASDLVAGFTLAAYAIPVSLAGLPPQYGDMARVRMLADLSRELGTRGIDLRLAEAHEAVRELVQKESGGQAARRLSVDEVIASHVHHSGPAVR